jgi:hypothetical protein
LSIDVCTLLAVTLKRIVAQFGVCVCPTNHVHQSLNIPLQRKLRRLLGNRAQTHIHRLVRALRFFLGDQGLQGFYAVGGGFVAFTN